MNSLLQRGGNPMRNTRSTALGLLLILIGTAGLSGGPAIAQKAPFGMDHLLKVERIGESQPSPVSDEIVYTVRTVRPDQGGLVSKIWVRSAADGAAAERMLPIGDKGGSRPKWSPDGRWIAYESSQSGSSQLWVMAASGGEPRQVTTLSTGASGHLWSPDSRYLYFTSDVWPDLPPGDSHQKAKQKQIEDSGIKARVIDGLLYRHWNEWRDGKRTHLFKIAVEGGEALDLTPGDSDVPPFSMGGMDGYAVSPNGAHLAFTRGPLRKGSLSSRDVEAWSTDANIWIVPAAGGEAQCITAANKGWDGSPAWSPDGKYLAFRSQERDGYEADRFRLAIYDRVSGVIRYLAGSLDRSVDDILWSRDSRSILIGVEERGSSAVYEVVLNDGREVGVPRKVFSGAHLASISRMRNDRSLLVESDSLTRPSELAILQMGGSGRELGATDLQWITTRNRGLLESSALPTVESVDFSGARGARIQAWLLKPPGFDPSRKHPFLLLVHGGPQSAWRDAFSFRWSASVLSARGYVVLMPNPHGSTGFGQKFTEQISGDWGGDCYTDVLKATDWAVRQGWVDGDRMGAMGGSFGGYMMNWILGHTDRFKALVSHAGVYNLESMYGTTEELWFPEWDLGGTAWKNRGAYTKFSPHRFAANFRTPTLVTHGELDFRVPVDQGMQLFTALKRQGVEARFLCYPDEGHWILKPRNSRLFYDTVFEWLDRHLKP